MQQGALSKIFPLRTPHDTWLFIAPHDDDLIIGCGLLLQAAKDAGINTDSVIVSDGSMGYCTKEQKKNIGKIRKNETCAAFQLLGLKEPVWLDYPDTRLSLYSGRYPAKKKDSCAVMGFSGLQNSLTYFMRKSCPSRIFVPAGTDLHPDHKTVHAETMISLFHSQGQIWPELGEPLAFCPEVYESAVYCDFASSPDIKLETDSRALEKKLSAIKAWASQAQIESLVNNIRKSGAVEYFRTFPFNLYAPDHYRKIF
ncbi:MAG: hypothetical protein A2096_06400 [Spirochaetes bacterium GWF1_41_5]|nr:MAG: hypothetical protein A2096_06400 [Spirochaetes bacterium GWF1_41_5]